MNEMCLPERTQECEAEPTGGWAALDCVALPFRYAHEKRANVHELTRALSCSGTRAPTHVHTGAFSISAEIRQHTR